MARGANFGPRPFRGLIVGYPKGGKTGAIISLLEAGFKVRMLDFDGNIDVILNYASEKALKNLDVIELSDRLTLGDQYVQPSGIPDAFTRGMKMMQEWKYTDPETGEVVNLGASSTWGQDTVVVVDSMSSEAEASHRWAMKMMNKNPGNLTSAVWGAARANLTNAIKLRASKRNNYHLVYLGHLQLIGPKDFMDQSDDKKENEAIKEKKLEAIANDLIPTRLYPVAVTKNQSINIHKEFPTMILAEKVERAGKVKRILRTVSGMELDLGVPSPKVKAEYPVETGLLDIFKAFGIQPPNERQR